MKTVITTMVALLTLCANAEETTRDKVHNFLSLNVIGRTQVLQTQGEITVEGTRFHLVFDAEISYSNLEKTKSGLKFNETRKIIQTNTKLNADGSLSKQSFNLDRTVVLQYQLGERLSTGNLAGLLVETKNTLRDSTGVGYAAIVEISEDQKELYIYDSMALYVDGSPDGRVTVPVASASHSTLYLDEKGKLQRIQTSKFYDVDVEKDYTKTEVHRVTFAASEK